MHKRQFWLLVSALFSWGAVAQATHYPVAQAKFLGCQVKEHQSGTLIDCSFVKLNRAHYSLFQHFEKMVKLDLSHTSTNDMDLLAMGLLPNVMELNLSNTQVNKVDISNYPKLSALQINDMTKTIDFSYLFSQLTHRQLDKLELEHNDIHTIDLRGIKAKYISLYNNPLDGDVNISALAFTESLNLIKNARTSWKISGLSRLKKLYLSYNRRLTRVTLEQLPNLRHLDIAYNPNLKHVLVDQCINDVAVYRQYSDNLIDLVTPLKRYSLNDTSHIQRLL